MMSPAIRSVAAATVLAVTAVASPPLAHAASFDGTWSVNIITRSGPCDQSYRFGVAIRGGHVYYLGGGAVAVSGRVSRSGQVSVSVASGSQSASGTGRLANGRGGGTWRGRSPTGACAGVWSASQG
jgi:hypothetical protein